MNTSGNKVVYFHINKMTGNVFYVGIGAAHSSLKYNKTSRL